jgi:tRNA G37 N-methylase Trm5
MKLYDVPQIGAKMYLRDETDLWGFLQNGEYEPAETKLVQSIVKKDWVCFDVGANIGYYTILMAKLGKEVYAFEAEPYNYRMLIINMRTNNIINRYLLERALSEYKGLIPLYLCDKSLQGMVNVLKRDKPRMLIEFHPPTLEEAGTKPEMVYHFLVERGYKIELVDPYTEIKSYEQLDKLTRNESGGQNIFCQQ